MRFLILVPTTDQGCVEKNLRLQEAVIRYSEGVFIKYVNEASKRYRALRIFWKRGGYTNINNKIN